MRPLCGACEWVRGTCSQHAGAAVAEDPRVLRGSPHSFERKRVPPLFLLSAPMVGGRDWSSGGRARDAPAARARRREDAARAAALTERAALTSFDRPPIVIKRTFPRGVSPWDVSHSVRSWAELGRRVGRHGDASPTTSSRCARGAGGRGAPPHSNPRRAFPTNRAGCARSWPTRCPTDCLSRTRLAGE